MRTLLKKSVLNTRQLLGVVTMQKACRIVCETYYKSNG
jgi:hypothetical protein